MFSRSFFQLRNFSKDYVDEIGVEGLVGNIVTKLPNIFQLNVETQLKIRKRDLENINGNSAAIYFLKIVSECDDAEQRIMIKKELEIAKQIDIVCLSFVGPQVARLIDVGKNDPESVTFEERVMTVTSSVVHSSEKVYRPLVRAMLLIAKILNLRDPIARSELGAIISESKTFWEKKHPQLTDLLFDEIRVIRNSEAHKNTKYDPRKETVAFINMKNNEITDKLVLNDQKFQITVGKYLSLCLTLFSLFNETRRIITV